MTAKTHLDLFSGIGGFAIAAQNCGFETIGFSEIDPDASLILAAHWPKVRNFGDVRNIYRFAHEYPECECCGEPACERHQKHFSECECVGCSEWDDEIGEIDLITGGVPCQPASALGKMRGTSDERWLWPEVIRIVGGIRPRFGLFENPPSILGLESGGAWNGIVSEFSSLSYDCFWEVLPAAAFGAGHLRKRIFLLIADSNRQGLEGYTEDETSKPLPSFSTPNLLARQLDTPLWYEAQSPVQPLVNGLPAKLVESALRCVGNSIVPQVAEAMIQGLVATEQFWSAGGLLGQLQRP